jgi:hypothetical protein
MSDTCTLFGLCRIVSPLWHGLASMVSNNVLQRFVLGVEASKGNDGMCFHAVDRCVVKLTCSSTSEPDLNEQFVIHAANQLQSLTACCYTARLEE